MTLDSHVSVFPVSIPNVPRPLHVIAEEIARVWARPYFGAVPYLRAMHSLGYVGESYGCDSGASIVTYFLANASTFRGDDARRIKAELKRALKGAK